MSVAGEFSSRFEKLAAQVRRRLELRSALVGLACGALFGGAGALGAWALRAPSARAWVAAGAAVVGALVGVWLAKRRAFDDEEVALWLDRRLGSDEVIVTALAFASETSPASDAARVIVDRATRTLRTAVPARVRPALLTRAHALLPIALGLAIFASSMAPRAPLPAPPAAPGSDVLTEASVPELEAALEALADAKARDRAQEERLQTLRSKAAELREKLAEGAPRREIMSELSELSDAIAREQLALGEGKERQGFEAALEQMKKAELDSARQAMAEHDPEKLEREISRAANKKDAEARNAARKALADAAKAARDAGAPGVAEALEAQVERFDREAKKAEQLRALADALKKNLSESEKADLEAFDKNGDPEAGKRLADALEKALEGMSAEDLAALQQELARDLQKQSENGKPEQLTAEQKRELAELMEQLKTEAGREALEEAMRQMAAGEPASDDAKRAADLAAAAAALAQMKQRLAGGGPPAPGAGSGPVSSSKPEGRTSKIDRPSTPTKASASINPGMPLPGSSVGRTSSRPGETANKSGTGALGRVGADEIGGVSQSEVPDEYREQVGRYFQP